MDSKIAYREDEARADAFFVTYVTLGDLWSHGAFSAVKPGSWQARLRDYLVGAGVSEEAIANAHVDPATFMEETTSRLWELGIDVVHVMLTQSGHGLATAEAVGEGGEVAAKAAEARGYGGDAKNNTEVLRAILGKFPESPPSVSSAGTRSTRTCRCTAPNTERRRGSDSPSRRPRRERPSPPKRRGRVRRRTTRAAG